MLKENKLLLHVTDTSLKLSVNITQIYHLEQEHNHVPTISII